MDISIYFEEAAQVSVAFVIGAIIGLEREFRSKPAGFRTMILICVGSCLYTILSKEAAIGSTEDAGGSPEGASGAGRAISSITTTRRGGEPLSADPPARAVATRVLAGPSSRDARAESARPGAGARAEPLE